MADPAHISARREFLSLAITQLPLADREVRREWDRNLSEYLRLEALAQADERFGSYSEAYVDDLHENAQIQAQFGKHWRSSPSAMERYGAANARLTLAEEKHARETLDPMWWAANRLLRTPAPDLAAALLKVELIEKENCEGDDVGIDSVFEIVARDLARFAMGEV